MSHPIEEFEASIEKVVNRAIGDRTIRFDEKDDAAQYLREAVLGLVAAFDPSRGVPMSAWVHSHLRRRLVDYKRSARRTETYLPLSEVDDLADHDADPLAIVLRREERAVIRRLTDTLPDAEREVIARRYGIGCASLSEKELVDAGLGTRDALAARHRRGLTRLRGRLGEPPGRAA